VRNSTIFILITAANIAFLVLLALDARHRQAAAEVTHRANAQLAGSLQLTDLCLFTEARYTRHPSMADIFSPFQDHPLALEHFPSGSLVTPPRFRREGP
jgi:hypothetical protein